MALNKFKRSSTKSANTGRKSAYSHTTRSGKSIAVNRTLSDRRKARKSTQAQLKSERLATMPAGRFKRLLWRLQPKRMWKYWTSREGMIMGLKLSGVGILATFLLVAGVFAYFRKDLPNIRDVSGNNIGGSVFYYDRSGQTLLWEDVDGVKRIPVKTEQMSKYIRNATIAIEDRDFYNHGGFDTRGIIRAAYKDVTNSGSRQGGSTITQQLVKLTQDWTNDRTYSRKIKEIILSVQIEQEYTKDEILTGYLNTAPYGGIEYGVEAAANDYFQKSAKDLDIAESALLAAIPQSPTHYSPYGDSFEDRKEDLLGRQHYIIDLMAEQGMISGEEKDAAKTKDILATIKPRKPRFDGIKAPWFVLTAKSALEQQTGSNTVKHGGLKVITTLDLEAQRIAEEQVQKGLAQVRRQGGDTAAFVAEDVKTGQVVALVGGDDFNNIEYGQNNYAHELELPPGSSFKPYDYAALIDKSTNVGAGSVLYDTKGPVPGYPCTTAVSRTGNCLIDYDLRFPGPLTLRYSLGGSRNIPAIKAMLTVGVDETIDVAHRLMTSFDSSGNPNDKKGNYNCYSDEQSTQKTQCYAASAIGDGAYLRLDEHAHGYASLARNGRNIPQTYILKVSDSSDTVLNEWQPSEGTQAINEESAYIVGDMMSDPNASYLSNPKPHRYNGWKFAAKTGTTNDSKDGLMGMFSARYAAMVWVGYHNRTREMSGFMENMTMPIVNGWMKEAHANLTPEEIPRPAGIQSLPAFVVRTHVGVGSVEPSPANDLFPSWYKKPGQANVAQKIDKVSGKLATECTPARAIETTTGGSASTFSVDKFVGGSANPGSNEKDDVHKCEDAKPNVTLLTKPVSCNASSCVITAVVGAGTHPIASDKFAGTVNFIVDGAVVNTQNIGGPGSVSFNYPAPSGAGSREVKVEFIDSVLYDASDSTTLTVAVAPAFTLTSNRNGVNVTYSWAGAASGTVTVYNQSTNSVICSSSGGSCVAAVTAGTVVYAKDSSGDSTGTLTTP
jgi:membrane peptidoglycan carboxypeptidase